MPGAGEVLVEVLAWGICGSDLHCARHGSEFNAAARTALGVELMDLSKPVVLGHEFVGRVNAYGPGTERRIPLGRRVVSMPALPASSALSSASAVWRHSAGTASRLCCPSRC